MLRKRITLLFLLFSSVTVFNSTLNAQGQISGNFQLDAQYYLPDSVTNAFEAEEKMRMNGFANFNYTQGNFRAGLRYEAYLNPLGGFLPGYTGQGIPYRYAGYTADQFDITVGSFYEQFGSGMIFRTYEERTLGYDNAMDGFRVKFNPYKGIYLKGIWGKQRVFFTTGPGIVRGFDGEILLNELFDTLLADKKTKITIGGSFVSKYQDPSHTTYVLPANVGSWAGRISMIRGGINLYAEYAYKINDPSFDNQYIYKPGEGLLLNLSYSQKGFGISLAAKYIDNMSYRSDRDANLQNLLINYNPAISKPHTYNLAATLYPYATQLNGEVAYQAEVTYKAKKGTILGGKYGSTFTINFSAINGLDSTTINDVDSLRTGYSSKFFAFGENKYFRDFNIEWKKKVSDKFKMTLMYIYFEYDIAIIQGHVTENEVFAHIGIADLNYKFNKKHNLRVELQHLYTEQHQGNWVTVLAEYTVSPHWFIAALDQFNYGYIEAGDKVLGNHEVEEKIHYPYLTLGYINGSNRISVGYGRQRAGLFCVGGVCRAVPASTGFAISITSSF
jgi:hypothetical protein